MGRSCAKVIYYNMIENKLNDFKNKKIAIIGDIILDKYILGKVERISPEAPIPVVSVLKEKYVPGGAANVAANISTLGGQAFLFGLVGNDYSGELLLNRLSNFSVNTDGIIKDSQRKTTEKIRVIGHNQQLLRIDYEDTSYIPQNTEVLIVDKIKAQNFDIIIISDYAKGTITSDILKEIKLIAKKDNIKIIIDPKPSHKNWYHDSFLITPNQKEAGEMLGENIVTENDFIEAGIELVNIYNSNIVITAGSQGMYVFEKDKKHKHIHTKAKEVYDVSGAGDTVVATLALGLSANMSLLDSAELANLAAGIKVGKLGTAPVKIEELKNAIKMA